MRSKDEFCKKIKETIEEVTFGAHSATKITDQARLLADLNIDSLDYATILLTCEGWSGVKVKEDGVVWSEVDTVERLADLLSRAQSA